MLNLQEFDFPPATENYVEVGKMFLDASGLQPWMNAFLETASKLTYASDCSGADVPYQALEMLLHAVKGLDRLAFLSASECHRLKRVFLRCNFQPREICPDIFMKEEDRISIQDVDIYCAGFPCTPYSMLSPTRRLLNDENARQLFRVVKRVKCNRPKIVVLENVLGFLAVLGKVLALIRRNIAGYRISSNVLNPTFFGAPLSRKRIFIIMVRDDCIGDLGGQTFDDFILAKLTSMKQPITTKWQSLLLPDTHRAVNGDRYARNALRKKNAQKIVNMNHKWIAAHRKWARTHKVDPSTAVRTFKAAHPRAARFISTHREMEAVSLLTAVNPAISIVNTSQNLHCIPFQSGERCNLPCLTPKGKWLALDPSIDRYLVGREICLLMGMAVHRMDFDCVKEQVLHDMGGNAMNLRAVFAALCAAISSTDPAKNDAVMGDSLGRYDPTSSPSSASSSSTSEIAGDASSDTDNESSSSGSSRSSSDAESEHVRGWVDISIQRLQSMHGVTPSGKKIQESKFAKHGRSKLRIKTAIANPVCQCQCRVPLSKLLRLCIAFWLLGKSGQDSVLWTIQHETAGHGSKKDWFIEGHQVCKVAWMHLLGIGKRRLSRCRNICYGKDGRSVFRAPCRKANQAASVRAFFLHMYWSAGEPMTKEVASKASLKAADDDLRNELLQRLIDSRLAGPFHQISFNSDPTRLPLRELPHGSWSELFLLYKSYSRVKSSTHASRSTFFSVANEWKQCLRFHKKTHHAQCVTCAKLRVALQNTRDFREQAQKSDELLAHFSQTWRDRQVYWLARERAQVQRDMLVIIVDGYDHAKMSLPKWPMSRTPKRSLYENTRRTSLSLTGCIVHGVGVYLYMGDEGLPGGSNWTLECVSKSIDFAWAKMRAENLPWPSECLTTRLAPLFAKSGLEFKVEHVDTVRNWCHLTPSSSTLSNAYLSRKTDEESGMKVPQSFSFMCREDMPGDIPKDEKVPRRLRLGGNSRDVFAMVKGYMSDTSLVQPPLLVYPEAFKTSTESYLNQINNTHHVVQQSLEAQRVAELQSIADALEKDFPRMDRAVQYYRNLIDDSRYRKPYRRLAVIDAGPPVREHIANIELGARPPEPRNHWLKVTASKNLGQHVQEVLGNPEVRVKVITRLVHDRCVNVEPKPDFDWPEEALSLPQVEMMLTSFRWIRYSWGCVENFITSAQDRSKNAHVKSMQAAFAAWVEQLRSDEVQFESQQIMCEREVAKRRAKLIGQLEDLHKKAWDVVGSYLSMNMRLFSGLAKDAESTVLPAATSWIQEALQEIPECRTSEDHCIVVWANLPCLGVLGVHKYEWIVTAVTNLLASYRRNGIAILIHTNRGSLASEKKGKHTKDEPEDDGIKDEAEDDPMLEVKKDESDDDDAEPPANEVDQEEADIRDTRYRLEKDLSLKERNLIVRNITWVFDKDTVYGRRDGVITGLAVINRDRANLFKSSPGFKSGVIHDIHMCPRNAMWKPEVPQSRQSIPHLGRAMTDQQELKQVAAGTHILRQTIKSFTPATCQTTMLVDIAAYDCFPALAALEEMADGHRVMCGSIVLNNSPDRMQHRIADSVYNNCREGKMSLPSFPDFTPVLGALRDNVPGGSTVEYKVCVARGSNLVVLQSYARKWMEYEGSKDQCKELIEQHNATFNKDGDFVEDDERTSANDTPERPTKKIKIEQSDTCTEADISSLQKPRTFSINGSAEFIADESGEKLFLVSKSRNQFLMYREMFSFGSGEWRNGSEASELMSDAEGRWFSFQVNLDSIMLLEKRGVPNHLQSLPCIDNPVPLSVIIRELEDAGEVKLALSHHSLNEARDQVTSDKPLVFVMEQPKQDDDDDGCSRVQGELSDAQKVQKEHKEKARRPVSDSEDSVKVVTEVSFRPPAFDLQALMAGRPSQSSSAATRPSSSHAGVKGSNPSSGSRPSGSATDSHALPPRYGSSNDESSSPPEKPKKETERQKKEGEKKKGKGGKTSGTGKEKQKKKKDKDEEEEQVDPDHVPLDGGPDDDDDDEDSPSLHGLDDILQLDGDGKPQKKPASKSRSSKKRPASSKKGKQKEMPFAFEIEGGGDSQVVLDAVTDAAHENEDYSEVQTLLDVPEHPEPCKGVAATPPEFRNGSYEGFHVPEDSQGIPDTQLDSVSPKHSMPMDDDSPKIAGAEESQVYVATPPSLQPDNQLGLWNWSNSPVEKPNGRLRRLEARDDFEPEPLEEIAETDGVLEGSVYISTDRRVAHLSGGADSVDTQQVNIEDSESDAEGTQSQEEVPEEEHEVQQHAEQTAQEDQQHAEQTEEESKVKPPAELPTPSTSVPEQKQRIKAIPKCAPKSRPKAKGKAKAKARALHTAKGSKASPKAKAKASPKAKALAKRRAQPKRKAKASKASPDAKGNRKARAKARATPASPPKHDPVKRKMHAVYSAAWHAAKASEQSPKDCGQLARDARLQWVVEHGPRDHPLVRKYLKSTTAETEQ
eukprot:symbB.v1.2.008188.t2/scaffold450.1/size202773/7